MDRMDEKILEIITMIGQYGVAIQSVMGGEGSVPFSYTIGLTEKAHKEIMILGGIRVEYAAATLNELAARVIRTGAVFKAGDRISDVIEKYDVVFVDVDPAWNEMYRPRIANVIYTRERVGQPLQMVFPDQQGRFPWEDGYTMVSQPVLGTVPPGAR